MTKIRSAAPRPGIGAILDTSDPRGHVRTASAGTFKAVRRYADWSDETAGHMHLTIKGKQLDVGDSLRAYVTEQLGGVAGKYFSNPIEATVVLSQDAYLYRADISVHVGRGMLLQAGAEATEIYPAFDAAADKVGKRLRRYKRRLKAHHGSTDHKVAPDSLPARERVIESDGEDVEAEAGGTEPVVIAEMQTRIETMSVAEAVMRMDLGELPALLFRNGAHGELNMIYRRPDGHVGWVDPTSNKGRAA